MSQPEGISRKGLPSCVQEVFEDVRSLHMGSTPRASKRLPDATRKHYKEVKPQSRCREVKIWDPPHSYGTMIHSHDFQDAEHGGTDPLQILSTHCT